MKRLFIVMCILFSSVESFPQVRIRDVTTYPNTTSTTLTGYGLVVGLAGTGDGSKSTFTPQSFATMLKNFGIQVDPASLKLKNIAAVMVSCEINAGSKIGSRRDVLVSSLGDATSLQGGTLLRTVLQNPWGKVVAEAQGPMSIGGFNFESQGSKVSRNHSVVGRIPNGGVLMEDMDKLPMPADSFVLSLLSPDLTLSVKIAEAINSVYSERAEVADPATVVVRIPEEYATNTERLSFQAAVTNLTVTPAPSDKIVINERTGTIVVGAAVVLLPGAVTHGNLTVEISEKAAVSQPQPFSNGTTVVDKQSRISVDNAGVGLQEFNGSASVGDVARTMNQLGVSPRDLIAIFQGLKEAGSLQAQIVII